MTGTTRSGARVSTLVLVAAFGLLYAYDLFEAISNLVGVVSQLDEYNRAASEVDLNQVPIPWVILVTNIAIVPVAFAVALMTGRRLALALRALVMLAGLAAVAALSLSLAAFV